MVKNRSTLIGTSIAAVALLLAGCTGPTNPVPTGILVDGLVLDADGDPAAGLLVFIPGHPTEVSAADGSFSFEDVSAPYDLTVVDTSTDFAHTLIGLTTDSPIVVPLSELAGATGTDFEAQVTGSFLHATLAPLPADHRARICAEGVGRVVFGCTTLETGSLFTVNVSWSGNTSVTIRLRAVIVEVDTDGLAIGIVATGTSSPIVVSDGGSLFGQDVTVVDDTAESSVTVTADLPPGYSPSSRELVATHTEFASFSFGVFGDLPATGTALAPQLPGATYTVVSQAFNDDVVAGNTTVAWNADVDLSSPITLSLPTPPSLVSPADMVADVDLDTQFTVENPEGGVLSFVFQTTTSDPLPSFVVTTAEETVSIPDLSTLGLPLPEGAQYSWVLLSTPDVASTDEAVSEEGYLNQFVVLSRALQGGAPAPTEGGRISTSPMREFTFE